MSQRIPRRYKDDVSCLTEVFGSLYDIGQIDATLNDFGKICQRDHLKIAAYQGLTSYLKREFNLTLRLTSRKTKNN